MLLNKQNFKSQTDEVLWLLQKHKQVSCKDFVMKYGITRFGACIFNLRHGLNSEGRRYKIEMKDKYVKVGKRTQRQTVYFIKK